MEQIPLGTPSTSSKIIPAILGTVVLTALVVGGSVYAYQKKQADAAQKDLQTEIDSLKEELAASTTATPSPSATTTPTTQPSTSPKATSVAKKTFSNTSDFTTDQKTVTYSFSYPGDWTVKKIETDPRQVSLTTAYGGTFYWLDFAIGGKEYYDYTLTATTVTLGGKSYTKKIFKKNGAETVVAYMKPSNATYIFPFDSIITSLPEEVVDELIPQFEEVIATLSVK